MNVKRRWMLAILAVAAILLIVAAIVYWSKNISPRERLVKVGMPATSTALPPLTPAANPPEPFVVQFPQGSKYEILGLTDAPERRDRWWAPNGMPIPAPSPMPKVSSQAGQVLEVVVRRVDPPGASTELGWSIDIVGPKVLSVGLPDLSLMSTTQPGGPISAYLFRIADNPPPTGDIRLELDWATWTERFDVNLRQAATGPSTNTASPPAASFEFLQLLPGKNKGEAYVLVRFSPEQMKRRGRVDEWLTVTDAAGKEQSYWDARTRGDGTVAFRVPVPRESIEAVRYRYRPRDVRKLRNVAFQPGIHTMPTLDAK